MTQDPCEMMLEPICDVDGPGHLKKTSSSDPAADWPGADPAGLNVLTPAGMALFRAYLKERVEEQRTPGGDSGWGSALDSTPGSPVKARLPDPASFKTPTAKATKTEPQSAMSKTKPTIGASADSPAEWDLLSWAERYPGGFRDEEEEALEERLKDFFGPVLEPLPAVVQLDGIQSLARGVATGDTVRIGNVRVSVLLPGQPVPQCVPSRRCLLGALQAIL